MLNADLRRENAHRLAGVLERYTAYPDAMQAVASALCYQPEQLIKDAADLYEYLHSLEKQTEDSKP